jgi:hypothetical protein
MKRGLIPRHEPEVIQAIATKRHFGNDERVPTTFFKSMMLRGVKIESRFRKAEEFELMLRIVPNFTDRQREAIESIFCDSKAGAAFQIVIHRSKWNAELARSIRDTFLACVTHYNGGCNGAMIYGGSDDRLLQLDPYWLGDTWP